MTILEPAKVATSVPIEGLKWTPHPIVDLRIPPLTPEQLRAWLRKPGGYDAALGYWHQHEEAIRAAEFDPLAKGFELPFWTDFRALLARKDELYALGGNGPGKTEIGGKLVSETLCSAHGMKVLCVATNENSSKQLQQPAVYKYLPVSARTWNERTGARRRDTIRKINYSKAGGFTEGTFVLPNASQCWFKTVEQYERDNTSFEGPEYDFVWIDEPAPIALVDTLSYRIGKRAGKFLFTFTAINGFDSVCAKVLTGAKVVQALPVNFDWFYGEGGGPNPTIEIPVLNPAEKQVEGCLPGQMPYIVQPLNPAQGVICLWTHWNLFLPRSKRNPHVPAVFDKCLGKSKATVRVRLFGWAEKITGCQFPQFKPAVHVIPAERIAEILKAGATVYMACDPATARSYFMLWVCVDKLGRKFIFAESPATDEGEWVSDDGERGDGQRLYSGRGVNFYKAYIRRREHEHAVTALRRKGDPRAFATQAAAAEGGTSLFELFQNHDPNDPDTAPMFFEPAKVRQAILLDLEKINDELSYDEEKPINVENEPHLYISDRCENLIRAMLSWSPDQGTDSPWKDPVDTLRYLFDEPLHYVDPNVPEVVGGRGW